MTVEEKSTNRGTKSTMKITEFAGNVTRFLRNLDYYPIANHINSSVINEIIDGGKAFANFCSNSFLGLCDHPKIIEAEKKALDEYGTSAATARLVATQAIHRQLEERIALFKHRPDAVIFSAGMLANMGIIPALGSSPLEHMVKGLGGESLFGSVSMFLDEYSHSCIFDGASLVTRNFWGTRGKVRVYRHMDMEGLRSLLETDESEYKVIVTDGVFSIHGRLAPLETITLLAEEYGASVYVDDAHGTGCLGETGRGTAEYLGVDDKIDIPVGTFSKALACAGGFVVGETDFCDYLRIAARTYVFQTAMPPANAAGIIAALDVMEAEPERRTRLHENSVKVRDAIEELGFSTMDSKHHIMPVLVGDEVTAAQMAADLLLRGVVVGCIRYPAVPMGEAVLRCNMMATHTEAQLDSLVTGISELGSKYGVI